MSVIASLIQLLGDPPAGYDIVVWVVAALFLLFFVALLFSFLGRLIVSFGPQRR